MQSNFPNVDPNSLEQIRSLRKWAKQLKQDLAEGSYCSKKLEAADRRQLKKLEKFLKNSPCL